MIDTQTQKNSLGFTMIELIFVIIILGIVSSIGASIIAKLYENYILQRATHRASLKTELAAQQIANYLSYRVPGTILAKNPNTLTDVVLVTDTSNTTDKKHSVLEWIGSDNDGFTARRKPGWNGFADISASSQTTVKTPGSNLYTARTVISNLSNNAVNLNTNAGPNVAIFFRVIQDKRYTKNPDKDYAVNCMGLITADKSCISTVKRPPAGAVNRNETLSFVAGSATQKVLTEQYKLAWTAYAIVPFKTDGSGPCAEGESPCDLRLYYNYQPWDAASKRLVFDNTIPHATIANNVTTFKFAELGSTLRIKLCAQENIGDTNISICKEKAVIL